MKTIIIVGGGLFGCKLALFHKQINPEDKVMIIEEKDSLMTRASYYNQARLHSGPHYPRSEKTVKSCVKNHKRFEAEYPSAIVKIDNYYAIAKEGSEVTSGQFFETMSTLGVKIEQAPKTDNIWTYLNQDTIEDCFKVEENAIDNAKLCKAVVAKLKKLNVQVRLNTKITKISDNRLSCNTGEVFLADKIYLCAYFGNNNILKASGLEPLKVFYERALMLRVKNPLFKDTALTIMDGEFFSIFPFPSEKGIHTLSSVKHTVLDRWTWEQSTPKSFSTNYPPNTPYKFYKDAAIHCPKIDEFLFESEFVEIKSLLLKNEKDDGRPILFKQQPDNPLVTCIIGGKLDNVYDLLEKLTGSSNDLNIEETE